MAAKTRNKAAAPEAGEGNGRAVASAVQATDGRAAKKTGKGDKKEKKEKDPFADTSPMGLLKKEAAEKLGLIEKIRSGGWGALTSAENGRIGALVNKMAKERSAAAVPGDMPGKEKR